MNLHVMLHDTILQAQEKYDQMTKSNTSPSVLRSIRNNKKRKTFLDPTVEKLAK